MAYRWVGLSLWLCAGCDVAAGEEVGLRHASIVNGTSTSGDPAVVALVADGYQYCTGTLVSPRVVVTAAHCLPPHVDHAAEEISVFFGNDVEDDVVAAGGLGAVADAFVHPAWSSDSMANDLGLIALERARTSVTPIPLIHGGQPVELGEVVRLVGFGTTIDDGGDNGTKRAGMAVVDELDDSSIFLQAEPSVTCNGDSGGPLMVEREGEWVLAGIHSRSDCADQAMNERVDVHLVEDIRPFIAAHGDGTCAADGICAAGCEMDVDCQADGAVVSGGCAAAHGTSASPFVLSLGLLGLVLRAGRARSRTRRASSRA